MTQQVDTLIIGGGAAGMFAAIQIGTRCPDHKVIILESQKQPLQKVRISGGGRCNVTHHNFEPEWLSTHYPRGQRLIKQLLYSFGPKDMIQWLASHGVKTYAQPDGRVFPTSDESQTVIDCFMQAIKACPNIELITQHKAQNLTAIEDGYVVDHRFVCKHLILATGGLKHTTLFSQLDLKLKPLRPSLFAFDIADADLNRLSGISLEHVQLKLPKKKWSEAKPMVITHRGISGPAVLVASAVHAYALADADYTFGLSIRWDERLTAQIIAQWIETNQRVSPDKMLRSLAPEHIPHKLWLYILTKAKLQPEQLWKSLNAKQIQRIIHTLTEMPLNIVGKTTNKDEFVTAGGVDLSTLNPKGLHHKSRENLYIIGEALDIDGLTGGFNFQAAWTTAWVAAQHICKGNF